MRKVSLMRWADQWLGVPLCWLATVLEKLMFWRGDAVTASGGKLLVVKLSELGANVILGRTIGKLRETFARQNIYYMAFAESREILEIMDFVPRENLLLISTRSPWQFARDIFAALRRVRRERAGTALDLEFFSRASALLAWLSGARRRVGIHAWFGEGAWRGGLMTHRVKFNPHLHIGGMFRTLAEAATLPAGDFPRIEFAPDAALPVTERFAPADSERRAVEELLREHGWRDGEKIVLLNANTSDRELIPLRRWDENNYAAVARLALAEFPGALVLLTGSGKEADDSRRLARLVNLPRCHSVAGCTSLRELLTLYGYAALMVTNDSGPAHFAALTDMPVVVLFGPETPQLWRPLGKNVRVVCRNLACSPCFSIYNGRQSACRRNACMDMAPATVFAAMRECLAAQ